MKYTLFIESENANTEKLIIDFIKKLQETPDTKGEFEELLEEENFIYH